jgi:diguanylate cyclase (GGDEF)-like protein
MSFRFRLALFFVAALVAMQSLTAVLVYQVTRHELIVEGQRQLDISTHAFARQLDDVSERVASTVQVLALDYALRAAIAQHDEATMLSALRNHGGRVGATQMLLVGVDGRIGADTRGSHPLGSLFQYRDLVDHAFQRPAAAVIASGNRAYWMVVVPVFAPNLVGFIAAAIPIDDQRLVALQKQSTLPKSIELVTAIDGNWTTIAHGRDHISLTAHLAGRRSALPIGPKVIDVSGREFVAQAVWLSRSEQSAPVGAVLGYSVDEALRPYRSVATAWAGLSLLGLVVGLIGAWLIARGVSRPVEQLAVAARRIEAGDYDPPPTEARNDELGQLASAFRNMAQSIREREARILHQAGHDQVTELPNRTAAESAIRGELIATSAPAALLMIGLGRVPEIIKTMGHVVCDRVMRDTASRLSQPGAVGVAQRGFLSRATDTQFLVFLPGAGKSEAIATAFRINEELSQPYREADMTLDLAPAIGISLSPQHGKDAGRLMRCAEIAMIEALGSEDPIAVYDAATDPHRPERLSLMGDLREAIEHSRIEMHFQPKLHLASGHIDSVEGLARWRHATLGCVSPETFIALAEETGNIRRLTRWALAAGMEQAARWHAEGQAIRVSINVSARDLDDVELPRRIAELLAVHKVPPDRIALEITESAIMAKPDAAIATLRQLADQGIDLAIDDFGVGQSSFSYLRRLPVREIKIDKTFITHLATVPEDRIVVRSIIELGHDLGYTVTAEGVNDQAALDYLASVGCDRAQGYLISRALPVATFNRFITAAQWPVSA